MKKKVLITGATGFVGYHLIKAALANNLEVFANVRKSASKKHLEEFDINYVELNLESIYMLTTNIEDRKYDYIIHAAAVTRAGKLEDYIRINAVYSRNLALAVSSSTHRVDKFVFISSLAAIGPLDQNNGKLTDSASSNPVTNYGISKALAETYLNQIENLPLIIFRPTAVYGPREKDLFILIKSIKVGLEFYIGNEEQKLSFIYVKDLTDLVVRSLQSGITRRTYNVSDGIVYNRGSLAGEVRNVLGKKTISINIPLPIVKGIAWSMEKLYGLFNKVPTVNVDKIKELIALNWACDIQNIQRDLGFVPKFSLERGLDETIEWYRKNNWL